NPATIIFFMNEIDKLCDEKTALPVL
ncbi:MAG: hypothetical protein JWQ38_14, partial [Flavipsychrobacter sp.]|nr:hypothetical protein [Flavipsychrobacter sp.]